MASGFGLGEEEECPVFFVPGLDAADHVDGEGLVRDGVVIQLFLQGGEQDFVAEEFGEKRGEVFHQRILIDERSFLAGGGIRARGLGPIDSAGQNLVIPFLHGAL